MNAAVLHPFNESPRFEQFSEPIAEENEVIVHVRAAALKPVDCDSVSVPSLRMKLLEILLSLKVRPEMVTVTPCIT